MKRSLAFIALAAIGTTSAIAQSNVTLYGRINTTLESQKDVNAEGRVTSHELSVTAGTRPGCGRPPNGVAWARFHFAGFLPSMIFPFSS